MRMNFGECVRVNYRHAGPATAEKTDLEGLARSAREQCRLETEDGVLGIGRIKLFSAEGQDYLIYDGPKRASLSEISRLQRRYEKSPQTLQARLDERGLLDTRQTVTLNYLDGAKPHPNDTSRPSTHLPVKSYARIALSQWLDIRKALVGF